jgi:hypothetical protein
MTTTIDGSAGITTNAGGSVNPSTDVTGINYSCRAWVNFNGVTTVTIRASGNVTSVTRNGAGDYTVNFTTAMTDANYSVNAIAMLNGTNSSSNAAFTTVFGSATYGNAYTTTSIRLLTQDYVSIAKDVLALNVAIFR